MIRSRALSASNLSLFGSRFMGLSAGIVGLPNVGKSTIFNALTSSASAQSANYPFCTIEPNVGIVPLIDKRLEQLAKMAGSKQTIHTDVRIVDIAGLVRGASKGEGLGNQFLANIRETEAILHVVRCFDDPNIIHVENTVDPARDIEIIETELMLADLDTVTKRYDRTVRLARTGNKEAQIEADALKKASEALNAGKPLRSIEFTEDELKQIGPLSLMTLKPVLFVANVAEGDLGSETPMVATVRRIAEEKGGDLVILAGELESQIAQLAPEEREDFLKELGLEEPGLQLLARTAYHLLNLETFFTVGPKEARAWTIHKGAKAPEAAGVIHSDFERGFIRAETISWQTLLECGSEKAAKSVGKVRQEGRDYEVQDGDVMHFLFNV
jgi:ribosome-binding ATPase